MRPVLATAFTISYTLAMSEKALVASTLRGTDAVVRDVAYEWASTLCARCDVRVHGEGVERIDFTRPMVLAANHQSLADVPCIMTALGRSFGFLTKKELFRIPAFGAAMRRLGCVSIDRRDAASARTSIAKAAQRVRSGSSIVVFPEGTRSPDAKLRPFKKGSFHLVQAARVPMVPLGVIGTNRVLSRDGVLIRAGDVTVRVGEPMMCNGDTAAARDELRARMFEAIEALIR